MTYGECPYANAGCPEFFQPSKDGGNQENGCHTDKHHLYYGEEYKTGNKGRFARLGENVVQLCRWEHRTVHANNEMPPEPTIQHIKERLEANNVKWK